ncbi:unnamed protein product [Merluccius merluccius]
MAARPAWRTRVPVAVRDPVPPGGGGVEDRVAPGGGRGDHERRDTDLRVQKWCARRVEKKKDNNNNNNNQDEDDDGARLRSAEAGVHVSSRASRSSATGSGFGVTEGGGAT